MASNDQVQLGQALSYKDQAELYKTTVGTSYTDPYDNFIDPRTQKVRRGGGGGMGMGLKTHDREGVYRDG